MEILFVLKSNRKWDIVILGHSIYKTLYWIIVKRPFFFPQFTFNSATDRDSSRTY
jgi:hypothetical protein